MNIIEKIEKRIKILDEMLEENSMRDIENENRTQELEWVLSELQKIKCDNCKHNNEMIKDVCWVLGNKNDYCNQVIEELINENEEWHDSYFKLKQQQKPDQECIEWLQEKLDRYDYYKTMYPDKIDIHDVEIIQKLLKYFKEIK